MYKRAVILAGGKGKRLKPYTVALPKPLLPIGDHPIVEIVIRQLAFLGFSHITLAVNHQADVIKAFFGDGEKWNIRIDYSLEDCPLSTIAPLQQIGDLPENFLVMNGDVLTDLNFSDFFNFHQEAGNSLTVSGFQREQNVEYGVLEIDKKGVLTGFKEKPILKYNVSMGIYMMNKRVLKYIPDGKAYGFDELMLDLIKDQNPAVIKMYQGYWLDIGSPEDYMKANEDFEEKKPIFFRLKTENNKI